MNPSGRSGGGRRESGTASSAKGWSGTSQNALPVTDKDPWVRNLVVATIGTFTTIVGMTMLVPFLPVYIRELGVADESAVVYWSAICFGATFLVAAITAPVWGWMGDRWGRKSMLVRSSLGMAIAIGITGAAGNVWHLLGFRVLTGLLGGFASGASILVADQTPPRRRAFALGILTSGNMAGNLVGPVLGGLLPHWVGPRASFAWVGALIFLAFLGVVFFMKNPPAKHTREEVEADADAPAQADPDARDSRNARSAGPAAATDSAAPGHPTAPGRADGDGAAGPGTASPAGSWGGVPRTQAGTVSAETRVPGLRAVLVIFVCVSGLITFAQLSVEPFITVYMGQLPGGEPAALWGGIALSATAAGTMVAGPFLGRAADRYGNSRVLLVSLLAGTVFALVQPLAGHAAPFVVLRFALGLAMGGLMPALTSAIRGMVPTHRVGRILGLTVSAQHVGRVFGPALAAVIANLLGMPAAFIAAGVVLAVSAAAVAWTTRARTS